MIDFFCVRFYAVRLCGVSIFFSTFIGNVYSDPNELGYINDSALFQIDLGVGYDNNLYESSSVKKGSLYIQPSLRLGIKADHEAFGFATGYEYDSFIPKYGEDLAESNSFIVSSFLSPSNKNKYTVNILLDYSDELRGSGLTEGAPLSISELDHYEDETFHFAYSFRSSRDNSLFLDLSYTNYSRLYDSTRTVALNANLETKNLNANLGYIWSNEKRVFFQLSDSDTIFKDITNGSKDAKNQIASVGINWLISSQSDIELIVGTDEKTFDNGSESIYTDYWSASIAWRPFSYTELSFQSANEQVPSTGVNETSSKLNSLSLDWQHEWGGGYKTVIILSQTLEESIVSGNSVEEENVLLGVKALYRDFEVAIDLEKNVDVSSLDSFSQVSLFFVYHFNGGL